MTISRYCCILVLFSIGMLKSVAQVKVYPNPDPGNKSGYHLQSGVFRVSVTQNGKTQESFVYSSQTNFENPEQQTDFNHWTTFEFRGKIDVSVTRIDGEIAAGKIYPAKYHIVPTISKNVLHFSLDKPSKLFVDIEGMEENPLFVFADAPERDIPSRNDKNVVWFEAGRVYNLGLQYKVPNGKTVYIEGGAVVWGTFWCEDGPNRTTVRGKGVVSTRSTERKPGPSNIPFTTVYGINTDMLVNGITITDPVKFCILGRSKVETSNVKLFGWYHQTDGWGGGDNSYIDDSFIKVFDDNVKFYSRNQRASNLVIYQQHNGAPFQLSWGGQKGSNCLAENIDIVKCWVNKNGGPGNSAVLNLRKGSDSPIGSITIRNLRADQGIYQLIGFSNDKGSTVRNILMENIRVEGNQRQASYLENARGGKIENVVLKNVFLNSKCFSPEDLSVKEVDKNEIKITCD